MTNIINLNVKYICFARPFGFMLPFIGSSRNKLNGDFTMPDFDKFMSRHGESAMQALIETIERHSGVRGRDLLPLDVRWKALGIKRAANDNAAHAAPVARVRP
jgi:hypothetical protein